jgi:ATP-dependent DNA helicase PIF1
LARSLADNGLELVMEKKPFTKRLSNGNELSRKQFPLRLAWALTIHKSQGQTISKCIVDVANVFSSGQGYVALSRVSNSEGLWIKNSISSRNW